MNFKIISSSITTLLLSLSIPSYATELDDYLIQNQLIEQNYKIKDSKNLDDVLNALSDEDSRVLPVQIDQNTVIEKYVCIMITLISKELLHPKISNNFLTAWVKKNPAISHARYA